MSINAAILSTDSTHIAIEKLRAGDVVALPTETVYGLGADACQDHAVARIFALKGRPSFNPLIVHVTDAAMAQRYVEWNDRAQALADAHWPGPLTLVLPRRADSPVSLLCSAGGDTLAIRCPAHPLMREVLAGFDGGIAAPSANRSGRISPTTAAHVQDEFGGEVAVLDGGPCHIGIESTVVDCRQHPPVILRHGSVTQEQLGLSSAGQNAGGALLSPGMLTSHYAPSIAVRLNAQHVGADEALLAFGQPLDGAAITLNLSETGDLLEAAAHLFAYLRALDKPQYRAIAVMPVPMQGIGAAINDRLARAAAEK